MTTHSNTHAIFRNGRPTIGTGPAISRLNAIEETIRKLTKRTDDIQKGHEKCCKSVAETMSVLQAIKKNQDALISLLTTKRANVETHMPLQETTSEGNTQIPDTRKSMKTCHLALKTSP